MFLLSMLRRLWRRKTLPPINHTLICGASRSGKSEAQLASLVPLAKRSDCAIVLLDPPGTLASKFLLHLHALGLDHRVIYDRLRDTDRVPGYDWLSPSTNRDPLQREAENEERIREFASILLRRRGIQDTASTPLIEEGLLAALQLYLHQHPPAELPSLAEVFDLHSEARKRLLANCTEPKLVQKFHEYAALSPTARRVETAPAARILRAVLTSPAFRVRCGPATFDLGEFLDEKGILILDGSSQGNLSRDSASVIMGAVILRVIQHCRTGSKSRVALILDEAVNAGLIGLYESQALSEVGKWGLEFRILVQNPFGFASEDIRTNVLQNCWRHEWFRQGSPEAARPAAEDIATPLLDPLHIHHTEYRIRTSDIGYERVRTENKSETSDKHGHVLRRSITWQTVLWPRRREVADTQKRYTGLLDQVLLTQKALMLLKPGERFIRCDNSVATPQYVPMLLTPSETYETKHSTPDTAFTWQPTTMHVNKILTALRKSPAFRSSTNDVPDKLTPYLQLGASRRLARQ